eukprot:2312614-Rhodomonas_salina.2
MDEVDRTRLEKLGEGWGAVEVVGGWQWERSTLHLCISTCSQASPSPPARRRCSTISARSCARTTPSRLAPATSPRTSRPSPSRTSLTNRRPTQRPSHPPTMLSEQRVSCLKQDSLLVRLNCVHDSLSVSFLAGVKKRGAAMALAAVAKDYGKEVRPRFVFALPATVCKVERLSSARWSWAELRRAAGVFRQRGAMAARARPAAAEPRPDLRRRRRSCAGGHRCFAGTVTPDRECFAFACRLQRDWLVERRENLVLVGRNQGVQ